MCRANPSAASGRPATRSCFHRSPVRVGRTASWALAGALVLGAAALRYAGARTLPTPWITPDETLYGMLGRSLWSDGRLEVLGEPVPFYSLLHPLLVGLPLELWDGLTGYRVAQALGALAMAATALPVFAWGRTLMRPGWALVAAVLTVAIPALALSGLLMTETLFYPLATLAAWALAAGAGAADARPAGAARRGDPAHLRDAAAGRRLPAGARDRRGRLRRARPLAADGAAPVAERRRARRRRRPLGGLADRPGRRRGRRPRRLPRRRRPVARTRRRARRHRAPPRRRRVGRRPRPRRRARRAARARPRETRRSRGDAALLAVAGSLAVWLGLEVGLFATNYVEYLAEREPHRRRAAPLPRPLPLARPRRARAAPRPRARRVRVPWRSWL